MIDIKNTDNWEISGKYIDEYREKIEKDFPELDGKTIEICESKNYHYQDAIDFDSPTQMMVKDKDPKLDNDTIFYVNNYRHIPDSIVLDFAKEELFALISHEFGHIVAHYENEDCGGVKEEITADEFATKLGLHEPLICALEKIKNHKEEEKEKKKKDPFQDIKGIEKEINDITYRIKLLSFIE